MPRTSLESKQLYQDAKSRGVCPHHPNESVVGTGRIYCNSCLETARQYNHNVLYPKRIQNREFVFEHYGTSCVCCGESEPLFLTLDHINNDGASQRKVAKHSGGLNWYTKLASLIRKGSAPNDLQTLCFNCNCGKERNGGVCPHKRHR